ncbi:MAG TPA: glycosyl hydrolase family 32 [Microbacteriaceae bacterium]|jgi:sucrose-6-phosphate hydrolase SacC (GH32 family)|nr:glycosyl hydrolase family 32 [Microbacteriaceae bacterium]
MNDPNGLVYFKGVYHLYFQYNPEANVWGNMSWGHASSPDLVHWTEHPVAIPQGEGEAIYSGSAVVDHRNSSGFGVGDDPPLVAIYTSAYAGGRQAQSLAFSTDGGMTWTKHSGNPVLDRTSTAFRDPKVFWYSAGAEAGYWVMVAAEAEARQIVFYQSDDLRRWDYLSAFGPVDSAGGLWECPDLFALPVDGDPDRKSWVLIVSRDPGRDTSGSFTQYFVGDFDGIRFTPASDASRRLDGGRDLYAAVSFDNAPNGRRILIGWMSNWNYAAYVPTSPWRGSMSLPRELSLATIQGVVTLVQHLPAELRVLDQVADRRSIGPFDLEGTRSFDGSAQYRVDVTFEPLDAHEFGLDLMVGDGQATRLRYDVRTARLGLDRTHSGETGFEGSFASIESAPIPLLDGALHLRVLVDRGSVEVFAHGGAVSLTEQVFSTDSSTGFALGSFGGTTRVRALEWTPLRSEPIVDLG